MSWFAFDRYRGFFVQIVGEQIIRRFHAGGREEPEVAFPEADLPEEEREAAVEREADRREHEDMMRSMRGGRS